MKLASTNEFKYADRTQRLFVLLNLTDKDLKFFKDLHKTYGVPPIDPETKSEFKKGRNRVGIYLSSQPSEKEMNKLKAEFTRNADEQTAKRLHGLAALQYVYASLNKSECATIRRYIANARGEDEWTPEDIAALDHAMGLPFTNLNIR